VATSLSPLCGDWHDATCSQVVVHYLIVGGYALGYHGAPRFV